MYTKLSPGVAGHICQQSVGRTLQVYVQGKPKGWFVVLKTGLPVK